MQATIWYRESEGDDLKKIVFDKVEKVEFSRYDGQYDINVEESDQGDGFGIATNNVGMNIDLDWPNKTIHVM